jgi:hypothetical protein
MTERRNVREQIILTDTILVGKYVAQMSDRPQGWFATFADAGAAGSFNFMNVRNRAIGIMYNNQDARDQLPFGMRIMSIGIKFWSPAAASHFTACQNKGSTANPGARTPFSDSAVTDPSYEELTNREELHCGVWEADIPNHVSIILRTNQDIRLRGPAAMFTPGFGPVGGGWGWGNPGDLITRAIPGGSGTPAPMISQESGPPNFGAYAGNLETVQHGEVDLRQRFPFPIPMDVPKRANLSVELKLSQYGKELLKAMTGPYWIPMPNAFAAGGTLTKSVKAVMFGIDVTIKGERLVQQRGDYSV